MDYNILFSASQGLVHKGLNLTFYSDRPKNQLGGLLHGWGPLTLGIKNPYVDMMLVHLNWWQTHTGDNKADFSYVHAQIDAISKEGKKVYLYPHPAFPPEWANVKVNDPEWGWIDYFDEHSHKMQIQWFELISKEFGTDERVHAIRMSTFDHGELWVHPPRKEKLDKMAKERGITSVEYVRPYVIRLYEAFLKYAEPKKLIANAGGLEGDCLEWAVRKGTGHGTGTHQLDFAGQHQYPRKNGDIYYEGHLSMKTMSEDGYEGMYIAESQCWPGWSGEKEKDAFIKAFLCTMCSNIVHRTNYLMIDEMFYNRQTYERLTDWSIISPDSTGRLTRRGDESAKVWNHDEEIFQIAMWTRSLLGTSDATTPEAFVQLSTHYSAELGEWVMALEHGMQMDFERSGAVPVLKGPFLEGPEYINEIFGHRPSYFAKQTNKAEGKRSFFFRLNSEFQKSLYNRSGELLEVRITYFDNGTDFFELFYNMKKCCMTAAGSVRLTGTNEWRTACFLLVDPEVCENEEFEIELRSGGIDDLCICMIRVIKQYG